MSSIEMEDRTGMPRQAKEFREARLVVTARMLDFKKSLGDPELFVQLAVIIDALKLAEAVARHQERTL